jgi:ABC-2 type transport system ATP-binding protein
MIRKLELAVAIMIKPRILFLDEPTIGLDPATRRTVWEKLKKLNREDNVTIFFTTHYMDEADAYADQIGIIDNGKLVKVASADELKRSIGTEHIEIGLASRIGKEVLAELSKIKGIMQVESDGRLLSIGSSDSGRVLNDVMVLFSKKGIRTEKISISRPTIEEAFLKYVGAAERHGKAGVDEVKKTRQRIIR